MKFSFNRKQGCGLGAARERRQAGSDQTRERGGARAPSGTLEMGKTGAAGGARAETGKACSLTGIGESGAGSSAAALTAAPLEQADR
ncbi:hypothetical protein, partial [Bordetella avium]|uniref:hypothetical protein n=1 Tax=Bordetella avium TaxID=521 RepID=UPI003BF842F4